MAGYDKIRRLTIRIVAESEEGEWVTVGWDADDIDDDEFIYFKGARYYEDEITVTAAIEGRLAGLMAQVHSAMFEAFLKMDAQRARVAQERE